MTHSCTTEKERESARSFPIDIVILVLMALVFSDES